MKYDLHIHTKYSNDGVMEPKKIVKIAKKRGLDGIAITDHNTIKGGLKTKKYETEDFKIIIGSEIKTDRGEVIGLFLYKEIKPGPFIEVIEKIREQDGIIVVPHPFDTIRKKCLRPTKRDIKYIDAIEGINSRVIIKRDNKKAIEFGKKNNITLVAGSDAHFYKEIGNAYTKFKGDLRKAIKKNKTEIYGVRSPIIYPIATFLLKHIK